MEIISLILLILLSLIGYSAGAVNKVGKNTDIKPTIIDLIIVVLIWATATYSKISIDTNKWLLILMWLVLSFMVGSFVAWPQKHPPQKPQKTMRSKGSSPRLHDRLWQRWKEFSKRMGVFQSRIVLSLFFFTIVAPFALGVKIFSDPLELKRGSNESHWLPKRDIRIDLEQSRRQF